MDSCDSNDGSAAISFVSKLMEEREFFVCPSDKISGSDTGARLTIPLNWYIVN
jgi:hypothetical protein